MKQTNRVLIIISLILSLSLALYAMTCVGCWISLHIFDGGFSRRLTASEKHQRVETVSAAREWLGTQEHTEQHRQLLAIYNGHEPLAREYQVTVNDSWCAAFGSTIAIQRELTDIIPTECGCERQIELWKEMDRWTENDDHMPLPGDYIYYNWDADFDLKDNTGWSDHVGIVVGSAGPLIKVIEGNKDDSVTYRIIFRGDYRIRGYGLPDYASKIS